jgi:transmembrane sensor
MKREFIHTLIKKYLDGLCTDEERVLVDHWISLLDDEQRWSNFSDADVKQVEQRVWERLQTSIGTDFLGDHLAKENALPLPHVLLRKGIWARITPIYRVAAVLIMVIVLSAIYKNFVLVKGKEENKQLLALVEAGWSVRKNNTEKPLQILLEDGSLVLLNPASALYYPEHFDKNKREVRLQGTAFFSIAKNKYQPFFVYSKNITTRVLGTSFWVKEEASIAQVEVKTGKVSVFLNTNTIDAKQSNAALGVLLKPNEKVIFDAQTGHFATSIVAQPEPIEVDTIESTPPTVISNSVFNDVVLLEVIQTLEKEYGIAIVLESEDMADIRFTGDLTGLGYFDKIKLICKSIDASFDLKENRLLIRKIAN